MTIGSTAKDNAWHHEGRCGKIMETPECAIEYRRASRHGANRHWCEGDSRNKTAKKSKPAPFWQSLTIEELAEQQGLSAVVDLDAIAALWPANDDPNRLLRYILTERAKRRRVGKKAI
jgi:hypothetical protein